MNSRTAGAISALFGILFALPIIAGFLPGGLSDQVSKYLPGPAGIAITSARHGPEVAMREALRPPERAHDAVDERRARVESG
jgi:hypothetical protein